MKLRRKSLLAGLLIAIAKAASGSDALLLEWADEPRNPKWMPGQPVFQRTLICSGAVEANYCLLNVVTIGRITCPVQLVVDTFSTRTGDLRVERNGNAVQLEFTDESNRWSIRLELTGGVPFVKQASGEVVNTPRLPDVGTRSSALVALIKSTVGVPGREFAEVDLKCSKIAVVAAKQGSTKQ